MKHSFLPFALCLLPLAFMLSGCRQDMHDNPKFKPYREGANRDLPEGTVARGSLDLNPAAPKLGSPQAPNPQTAAAGTAAQMSAASNPAGDVAASTQTVPTGEDGFPFKVTKEILDRGEDRFNISCSPCHGKLGDGRGMITLRGFRHPPAYTVDRLLKAPSSYFYDVITNGFGAMPSYADQLTPEDRWKVIAYLRVLQLSQRANVNELPEVDKKGLDEAEKKEKQGAPSSPSGGHSNQ